MIEVDQQISDVRRSLGRRTLEAGRARVLTISQTYPTGVEDLWDACTNPERLRRWFLPVSGELRSGGRYRFEGNAGGTIERCEPPNSFAATWEFGGQSSWIEVRLTAESPVAARFELEHVAHVDDSWERYGPAAVGIGWDGALLGLARHLSGEDAAPEDMGAWSASDEGRRFLTKSGNAWCAADLASGTDPAEARKRAEATIAFYLGD